ncbi:hypothetical protein Tco_0134894 [Tanacetum coccineum]
MTTPCPIPFSTTAPRAEVFTSFVIISDSDDEITTLPIRPAPSSPNRTPALYGYLLDSGHDLSNEDMSETAKLLHTQTASTLVVHPPPTRSLPTSYTLAMIQTTLAITTPSVSPPTEYVESVGDNIEASIWNLDRHLGP